MTEAADPSFLPRVLLDRGEETPRSIPHADLLIDNNNLVILGEAGMGKSRLLEELAGGPIRLISARRLIHTQDPAALCQGARRLLIDAMDEAPGHNEGDAVDKVLAALERAGYPPFILSCRAEDWQAATARSVIREHYGAAARELRLQPLDGEQIEAFLAEATSPERAIEIISLYRDHDLLGWLGNPQTLLMVAGVVRNGNLPLNTSDLFAQFMKLCLRDANAVKRQLKGVEIPEEQSLDTLGAAFAALILSGRRSLATPLADYDDEDLPISELAGLPGMGSWDDVSGNRLVRDRGATGKFTYLHRRIGEWLAARWLAKNAEKPEVRSRLLARLTIGSIVPANLRGLFGWLAAYPALAADAIATDPMAVIEYGDADRLRPEDGPVLLKALEAIAAIDPYFRKWGHFRAKALVGSRARSATLAALVDRGTNDRLRMMLAEQFKGEQLDDAEIEALRAIMLDGDDFFAVRFDAAEALVGQLPAADWPRLLEDVRLQATHDATRLASEILVLVGVEHFADRQIVETILSECGHLIAAVPNQGENDLALRCFVYRDSVSDHRLADLLDLLGAYAEDLLPEHRGYEATDVTSLGQYWIARQLRFAPVTAERLWRWIRQLAGRESFDTDDERSLTSFLTENDAIRRDVQALVLLEPNGDDALHFRLYELTDRQRGFAMSDADVAALLDLMDAGDTRWRDVSALVPHRDGAAPLTRTASERFLAADPEGRMFLDERANPPKPSWEIDREERAAVRAAEKEARWTANRADFEAARVSMECGHFSAIIAPSNAYLGRFSDLKKTADPIERLTDWLGDDLAASTLRGLENYLRVLPQHPSAPEIADSYGKNRHWNSRSILIAALAERVRLERPLSDLADEQIVAAMLHNANSALGGEALKPLRLALRAEFVARPHIFETYARLLIEPVLRRRGEFASGITDLFLDARFHCRELMRSLAVEWLMHFPRMHARPEEQLIDYLLAEGAHVKIAPVLARRMRAKALVDTRRRNWLAVGLLIDFPSFSRRLRGISGEDRFFMWTLQARVGGRPYDAVPDAMRVEIAAWIVGEFRETYPVCHRPRGTTSGSDNDWNATDYLYALIDRIGSDTSDAAARALDRLLEVNDGYNERMRAVRAEQRRRQAELKFLTIDVPEIRTILDNGAPQTMSDLREVVLAIIDRVAAQIRSNDTDSRAAFYKDDGSPHDEEYCRDRLVDLMRQHAGPITLDPERHLGNDREGDIAARIGTMHLPLELKGQWHAELWTAADTQLDAQQAVDHEAEGYGIYLVMWFGGDGKQLKGPPRALGINSPKSAPELEAALSAHSHAVEKGLIIVRVIDLSVA